MCANYIIEQIDRLRENRLRSSEWDMNRNGRRSRAGPMRRAIAVLVLRFHPGLYHVCCASEHPDVIWQAGGGGRADLSILRLADQI